MIYLGQRGIAMQLNANGLPLPDWVIAECKERQRKELRTDIVRILWRTGRINGSRRAMQAADEIVALVREVYDDPAT